MHVFRSLGRGRRVRKMRRISGSFWTLERDERLRRLEAERSETTSERRGARFLDDCIA